jgi:ATP-dependent Clp protease ATP-binding subunit ClpA
MPCRPRRLHLVSGASPTGTEVPKFMFDRFTAQARGVVIMAHEEARSRGHDHIGTSHFLLGLIHDDHNTASETLTSLGISVAEVHQQIDQTMGRSVPPSPDHLLFTSHAKAVLERSLTEAEQRGHDDVDTDTSCWPSLSQMAPLDNSCTAAAWSRRDCARFCHNAGLLQRQQPDAFCRP